MWTVTKDVDELKAAIVYPGGPERWWALPTFGEYPLAWGAKGTPCGYFTRWESEQQRRDLKDTMYQTVKDVLPSVKLFDFKDLLQEALDEYGDDKTALKNIVSTCFGWDWPRIEKLLGDSWKNLTASQIIGQDCPVLKDGDGFKVGIRPVPWINNISEQGWMTSDGFIINNKQSWWRSREEEIMKAILEYHPVMKENVHVMLDMGTKDGCYLEGGDCCATSDDSTAITVGWHTNKEAAIEVSKALPDQTIYVVHKYPIEKYGFNGMVFAFGWHRDDIFAMVDENKVLCTPYIFDWPKGGRKWLIKLLKTLRKDIEEWHPILRRYREGGKEIPEWLMSKIIGDFTDEKIDAIKDVGTVEIYKNGKRVAVKDSFIDALIEDEIIEPDNIIYVGGHPDDYADPMEHFFVSFAREEGASPNCAENLKPGVIICHEACERTIKALKDHGVKAVTYKAFYQQKFVGPCQNCCFIPLWRE